MRLRDGDMPCALAHSRAESAKLITLGLACGAARLSVCRSAKGDCACVKGLCAGGLANTLGAMSRMPKKAASIELRGAMQNINFPKLSGRLKLQRPC